MFLAFRRIQGVLHDAGITLPVSRSPGMRPPETPGVLPASRLRRVIDAPFATLERHCYGGGMTTTPGPDPRPTARRRIENSLNRAGALMSEVDSCFNLGVDPRTEDASEQIALLQLLVAAANAHLRSAEAEMAFQAWADQQ